MLLTYHIGWVACRQHAILQILRYQRAQLSTVALSLEKSKNAKIDQK